MCNRRKPIESDYISKIEIPASVFSLEKDEIFPFERLSYNILRIGIEVLNSKELPEKLNVIYNRYKCNMSPWAINACIKINHDNDGCPKSYDIIIPEMLPTLLYLYTSYVGNYFFKKNNYVKHLNDNQLYEKIKYFINGANLAVKEYNDKGLAHAIRTSYNYFHHDVFDMNEYGNDYDLMSMHLAYHEIAHVYTISNIKNLTNPAKSCALEIIADLVAVTWIYSSMIKNTPDTKEYREYRGLKSYSETIKSNSIICLNSIMTYSLLLGISSAQNNNGEIRYDGTLSHPNSLLRVVLQAIHLLTLISTYFSDVLTENQIEELNNEYKEKFNYILNSGFINKESRINFFDKSEFENMEKAIELIKEYEIKELIDMVDFLEKYVEEYNNKY